MALGKQKREWAVEQLKAGRSVADVAADLHTTTGQVRWALKATEVAAQAKADRAARGVFSGDQMADVIRLYQHDRLSSTAIAARYGVAHGTILRLLRKNGITRREPGRTEGPAPDTRVCNTCGADKPIAAFARINTRKGAGSHTYICRQCSAATARERGYTLRHNTGLTLQNYADLLAAQNGACGLCQQPPGAFRLHVDHDHATSEVRGLLCATCNRNMTAVDDPAWLERALAWRHRHTGLMWANKWKKTRSPEPPTV